MSANTDTMPVLFLGHGSPMNMVEDNPFTRSLAALAPDLPQPRAILVVSAHWLTRGIAVTAVAHPRTIHDFYGFPDELYRVTYQAPGDPALAQEIATLTGAALDDEWGFDHASYSVLRHMYPAADIPLLELSLDAGATLREHYELGKRLAPLRDEGVLVVGSGNIVHNLRAVKWEGDTSPYPWAIEFDAWVRDRLLDGDDEALLDYHNAGASGPLSVPTTEHYLPLLYAIALRRPEDAVTFAHQGIEMGSVSMRCVRIG